MEEDRAAMTGAVASRNALKPARMDSEDILICVDVDAESTVEMKTTGTNGKPLTRLECIKRAITRFIHDKLAMNPDNRFAFATLSKSAAWLKKEFTSDAESAVASLRGLSATKSSGPADLTLLFHEAAHEAKTSRAQNRILRVILIYCRSSVRPTHDWLVNLKLFTLDVMYLHDKPGPDVCPQYVYGSFDDIIERVSEYQGYIFGSGQGHAQSVFKRMSVLLSYPPQRCAQVDLPKAPAKKVTAPAAVSCDKSASNARKEVKRPLEKTPTTNTKRIHGRGNHKASDLKTYDENIVGSRIKIWWPMDGRYYEAVVKSYDSAKKKHLVCYNDGDKEILYMREEKWYFVNESKPLEDEKANQTKCDEKATTMPQKKRAKTSKEQSTNKHSMMDIPPQPISFVAFNALKAAEVSTPELTCVSKKRLDLEHSFSFSPHDLPVKAAISSINEKHEAVSPRRETATEGGVKTQERRIQQPVAEEKDLAETQERRIQQPVGEAKDLVAETETQTHKRARVESCSLDEANGEMEKIAEEGEPPSCRSYKSSAEPGELQRKKVPQPCSVTQQLAKVKESIVDTIASVRQFRSELVTKEQSIVDTLSSVRQFSSEMQKKEDNLEASLLEIDLLGEKIMGINKILNSESSLE
ncbi:putative sister chromatid cohesion protein PDS5 [Cardamine amara subsp. amara]|uniref:BRISC and BRCA1-A complex member 1 n=1 Tax=Cardamine amara subsp. amara TaxID=228776 RepID=A0ABD1BYN7_CARAN